MARKSSVSIIGLCLLGLVVVGWGQTVRAQQVATCNDVCNLFPMDPMQVACLGEALQEIGYPVNTTAACAVVTNTPQCAVCYAALTPSDEHCAAAYQVCSLLQGGDVTVPPPGNPVVVAGGVVCDGEGECLCPGGQICSHNCPGGGCEMDCAGGAQCTLNCPGGGCELDCAGGAQCTLNCPGGGCESDCASGASCAVNCPGGNCEVDCVAGAACSINCPPGVPCECDGPGC